MNNHPLMCSSEGGFASVLPARASHDGRSVAQQEVCSVMGTESCEAKLRATALITQILPGDALLDLHHPGQIGVSEKEG